MRTGCPTQAQGRSTEGPVNIQAYQYMETIIPSPNIYTPTISLAHTCVAHEVQASLNENWLSNSSSR